MTAVQPFHPTRTVPNDYRHFKKIGSEEVHTIEAYERSVSGTPHNDPQRQFSTNQYTERRTYGRDENGEVVVKIEKDPREPVRPVSPVRPVGDFRDENILKPLPHIDTSPLHIPRVETHKKKSTGSHSPRSYSSFNEQVSPRSAVSFGQPSPRSGRSGRESGISVSPRSALSNVSANSLNVPMKKITKKSRLVSIYDGGPVSPYVETVTYAPAIPMPPSKTYVYEDEYVDDREERQRPRRQTRHGGRESTRSLHYADEMEPIPYRRSPGLRRDYERYDDHQPQIYPKGDRLAHLNGHGPPPDRRSRQIRDLEVRRSHSDPSPRRRRETRSEPRRKERLRRVEDAALLIENPLYRDD